MLDDTIKQSVIEHSLHSHVRYRLGIQIFSDKTSIKQINNHINSDIRPGALYVPINHRTVAFVYKEIDKPEGNQVANAPKDLTDVVSSEIDFFRQDIEELQKGLNENFNNEKIKFDGDEALQKFFLYSNLCNMEIFSGSQEKGEEVETKLDSYFENQNKGKNKNSIYLRFMTHYTLSKLSKKKQARKDLFTICAIANRVQLMKTKTRAEDIMQQNGISYDKKQDYLFFDTTLVNASLPLSREERLKKEIDEATAEIEKLVEDGISEQKEQKEQEEQVEKIGFLTKLRQYKTKESHGARLCIFAGLALFAAGLSGYSFKEIYMQGSNPTSTTPAVPNDDDETKDSETPSKYALKTYQPLKGPNQNRYSSNLASERSDFEESATTLDALADFNIGTQQEEQPKPYVPPTLPTNKSKPAKQKEKPPVATEVNNGAESTTNPEKREKIYWSPLEERPLFMD